MTLGQRIRQGRAKRDWNQKQLAEASQITQATISRLEADQVRQLKSDALVRLAEALGVTVDYLVGRVQGSLGVSSPDPLVRELVHTYERLAAPERKQLVAYTRFLGAEERGQRRQKWARRR